MGVYLTLRKWGNSDKGNSEQSLKLQHKRAVVGKRGLARSDFLVAAVAIGSDGFQLATGQQVLDNAPRSGFLQLQQSHEISHRILLVGLHESKKRFTLLLRLSCFSCAACVSFRSIIAAFYFRFFASFTYQCTINSIYFRCFISARKRDNSDKGNTWQSPKLQHKRAVVGEREPIAGTIERAGTNAGGRGKGVVDMEALISPACLVETRLAFLP